MKTFILVAALAAPISAQEAAPPPAEVKEAAPPAEVGAEPAPEVKPESKAEEAKPLPPEERKGPRAERKKKKEEEPAPAPPKAEEPAPAPQAEEPAPKAAVGASIEDEWAFAKSGAEDADATVQEAAIDDLKLFVRRHPDAPQAADAMFLLAGIRQKKGDWQLAMASFLHLLYEYPSTKTGLRAKSSYLELVDKKASRKQRSTLSDLVKIPDIADKSDRLSALWQKVADQAPDALYEPVAEEIRDFLVRFPAHKDGDRLQAALARLHAANAKPAVAMLAWRKLLALYPESVWRPQAQLAIGDLYADSLRDTKRAIDVYQELAEKYPKAVEVQAALQRSAQLFEDKLRQYDLAVEMHEKVVAGFPDTPASLRSFKAIARLQRERLSKPEDAIKTLVRLAQMHGAQDGVEALLLAADISHRDVKDYAHQAELLRKAAQDYSSAKEAPQALYDAAVVYESELQDNTKAVEVYKELAAKFPSNRLARKSSDRVAKLGAQ